MKTELLAPAGNYSKFLTALHFGADAVYVGGKNFSLRTFADNFTFEELSEAIQTAHERGKKVYVTANIFARNADFAMLEDYARYLETIGADAVIVSDPGVVYLMKKTVPKLEIHLSTQANTTNRYAVEFWKEQGVSRVILARELSIKEIAEIRDFVPDVELEAFVHGAMCISYSGRCLLSDYLDGRSSNRGACVQACRWRYEVRALNPTAGDTGWLPVSEDEKGSYIFNSKDLNMIAHLNDLQKAGVNSFKIEGRMKSEYYLATVINAYRRAIDEGVSSVWEEELLNVVHRDYTTAYAYGKNSETVNAAEGQEQGRYAYIANVVASDGRRATLEMRNRFKEGELLEVLSPSEHFGKTFTASNVVDSKGEKTDDAKLVQERYEVDCPYLLSAGDFIRMRRSEK